MNRYLNVVVGGILAIFILFIFMAIQYDKPKQNRFSPGIAAFGQGVSSILLSAGTEQMIYYDNICGVKISIAEQEKGEGLESHVVGNIDFIVISPLEQNKNQEQKQIWKQNTYYVVLRNTFDLWYKETEDSNKLEVVDFKVSSEAVNEDTKILEQSSEFNQQQYFSYHEPLTGSLMVDFKNTLWNIPANFRWQYTMTIDKNEKIILTLKPFDAV